MVMRIVVAILTLIGLTVTPLAQASSSSHNPPADRQDSNPRTGSITGRVVGEDGQPLTSVSVRISSLNISRPLRRITATDIKGNFSASDLPVGAYQIFATAPGLVSTPGKPFDAPYHLGENVTITLVKGGVITGKVLDATGQPVVGAPVSALRVRDVEGRIVTESLPATGSRLTDDRGMYRIFGLPAGYYIVTSGGEGESLATNIGARTVPTFYPSATRDTAQTVFVHTGAEIQGIDIRHRGEWGQAVSGSIVGAALTSAISESNIVVELFHLESGALVSSSSVNFRLGNGFGIYGVPDGEYEITARQQVSELPGRNTAKSLVSTPQRVIVRGKDVTGLNLPLVALSSIAGHVRLEKLAKSDCQSTRRGELAESLLVLRREESESRRRSYMNHSLRSTPNDEGEFVIQDLEAGRYRLILQLPSDHWYVKAMTVGATSTKPAAVKAPMSSLAMTGITLKSGETLSGVVISLAEGAASLSGRLEGKTLAARMRVHLVPAEKDAADEVLRYAEVVTRDGTFTFSHLAPGKYWILPRAVPEDESDEKPAKPTAWETGARVKLRREAESANQILELSSCQRVKDFVVRF